MGDLLGYARVSTTEQNASSQLDALEEAGCARVFVEHASGATAERVELTRLLDHARPSDTIVVWRLDRLGRSLRHLIDTVNDLDERKVGFRSLTEQLDTTTSGGKLVFHRIDRRHARPKPFDPSIVRGTEDFTSKSTEADHPVVLSSQ